MAQGRRGRRTAGSIRRLPSGRFQARVRCDDGTLQPALFTFSTKTEADRWLASAITDQAQGSWVDPRAGKVLFRDFAREWLHGKADLAPKTVEGYTYLIDHLLLPTLGDIELADLRPARVRAWRASLLRARRPGPTTIAKAYRVLKAMLSTAVIDNLIPRNPCVEKGAGVERSPEMRVPTPEEVRQAFGDGRSARNGKVPLRVRGQELLELSRDVHYEERAHPAYERLMESLAPDEARILRLLLFRGPQAAVDVRTGGPLGLVQSRLVSPGLNMIGARAGCRYVERVPSYLTNLNRLGLIWFSRETLRDPERYQVLEAQPDVLAAINSVRYAKIVRRSIHLTPFGEDFCRAALVEDGEELVDLPEHASPAKSRDPGPPELPS